MEEGILASSINLYIHVFFPPRQVCKVKEILEEYIQSRQSLNLGKKAIGRGGD